MKPVRPGAGQFFYAHFKMAATNCERVVLDSTEIIILTSGNLVLKFTAFGGFFWPFFSLLVLVGHEFMLLAFSVYCQLHQKIVSLSFLCVINFFCSSLLILPLPSRGRISRISGYGSFAVCLQSNVEPH